jgi:hypothetical protein
MVKPVGMRALHHISAVQVLSMIAGKPLLEHGQGGLVQCLELVGWFGSIVP